MGYDLKKRDRPRFVNGGTTLFEHCPYLKSRSVPLFKLFLLKKYKLEQIDDEKRFNKYKLEQSKTLWLFENTNWSRLKDHKYKVKQGSKYKLEHIVFCGYVCKFFGRQNLKCIKLLTNFGKININWSSCL